MSKSQHLKIRISSSTPVTNRKSEKVQKYNAPSTPSRCTSSRGNMPSSSSGSKRCGGLDMSESDINEERPRKKHKPISQVTMETEKSKVHLESVVSKTKKLTGRSFKFRFKRVSKEETVSGRDLLLSEESIDKEASNVDGGRSPILPSNLETVKSAIEESSAKEKHHEDQEPVPSQRKLALEDNSADNGNFLNEIQANCDKRMKKLIREQKGKIQEFHRNWEDYLSKQERDYKLEAAIIRTIHGICTATTDKLKILKDNYEKKKAENNLRKDRQLRELKEEQLAAEKEETQKANSWLSQAKDKSKHFPGAKDVIMPLTGQHGENNDSNGTVKGNYVVLTDNSDYATAEEVTCNSRNGNPGSANSSQRIGSGKTFLDIPISAVVEKINQPKHLVAGGSIIANLPASGERVSGEMQSLELHGEVSKLPETVASEIMDNANSMNVSTNTPIDSPDAEHLGSGEKTFPNIPASGERVPGEVQSHEQHGDVLAELPETVANEIVDNANPGDLSTDSPIEMFGEGDAVVLSDAKQHTQPKHFGCEERIFANFPASGEIVPRGMQLPDLCKDIHVELAETNAQEIVDNVNLVELSADTSIKGFGGGGAIDLPDALLNQRIETDRITIDNLGLAGQVLKTSEHTNASQHPYPLFPLRVQKDQDVVSAEILGRGVHVVGKVNSSPSEIASSEVVTARNSLSNTDPDASEEPAIESLPRTEGSTSKIIDTVIAESSVKLQDQDASVVKDQVTSQIEAAESERIYTAAPVAASELVLTAKTLQSNNKLQDQFEPAIETQSTSQIEVSVSENLDNTSPLLSSTEQQEEDALIVTNQVNLENSSSGQPENSTPVQCCTDAPPIESDEQLQLMHIDAPPICNQLPAPELERQSHNLGRNSSGAAVTEMLLRESTSQIRGDLESQINFLDFGPESQPSLAASVQISASPQNNVATEAVLSTSEILHEAVLQLGGLTHLPSDQVSPSLLADPLQNELQKIHKDTEEMQKSREDTMNGLTSEFRKEIAEVQKKYQLKFQDAQTQYTLKNNGLIQKHKKILMNKLLAAAFNFNCLNMGSTWPLMQQGFHSSSMQYHQYLVKPAWATAPNLQTLSLNGQAVQQTSVSNSTRFSPITSQHFAAPPVQDDSHSQAMSRLWAINQFHPMSLPHLRGDIYSSAPFQASIPAAAPFMPNATLIPPSRNLQQQRQQQPLAAPQWSSNSHNPYPLGYPPAVTHTSVSSLDLLIDVEPHRRHHHQLPGAVQDNNQSSFAGAAAAICISDDD